MSTRSSSVSVVDKDMDELDRVVERMKALGAGVEDARLLEDLVSSYAFLTEQIRDKQTTIGRLRHMLFGDTSEKREKVLKEEKPASRAEEPGKPAAATPPAKGHGRNGAEAYSAPSASPSSTPSSIRVTRAPAPTARVASTRERPATRADPGVVPIQATVFEQEEYRCNLCGELFPAALPAGVGEEKYDATVPSMVAVLRYGSGFPLNRIAGLQASYGVPLPAATQWDLVSRAFKLLLAIFEELIRLAAQGELLHNDDTTMVVLAS